MFGGRGLIFISLFVVVSMLAASVAGAITVRPAMAEAPVTTLVEAWRYPLQPGTLMRYGASPGIADLGPDVNNKGQEPNGDLEIVSGSDEFSVFYPDLGVTARGAWRVYDSRGNVEWARPTESDEARSSVAIADLAGDGNLEIVGGTTSGWNVEMMDRLGAFIWTYPSPPAIDGPFMWHSSPAVAQVSSQGYTGKLVIEGSRLPYPPFGGSAVYAAALSAGSRPRVQDVPPGGSMWAFDSDNSDGIDEGMHVTDFTWYPGGSGGVEGVDWDVIWYYNTPGSIISTPAVADIDGDGAQEVVFGTGYSMGATEGAVYALDAATGALQWKYVTGGPEVTGSAALADFDGDGVLEVVMGSSDNGIYFIKGDRNSNGAIDPDEVASYVTGGPVFSSAAVGDVDNDGDLEAVIGSVDRVLYALGYDPATNSVTLKWSTMLGGMIIGSPALANRNTIATHAQPWPFFRANVQRTGVYGGAGGAPLGIYITSADGKLYLLDGADGSILADFQTNGPIYTSPSVADVDGDNKLEIFFYDSAASSGGGGQANQDTFWAIEDSLSSAPPPPQWFWKAGYQDYAPSGVPDFDALQMGWDTSASGPMAVANSLWWFDSKFESNPLPPPQVSDNYALVQSSSPGVDDHEASNVFSFAEYLAGLMDTDGRTSGSNHAGTRILDMAQAVRTYLDENGLGRAYTVHLAPRPDFGWVASEVERSEDVVLLLGFWQKQPLPAGGFKWVRLGGNYVTVAGVSTEAGRIALSDPLRDAAESGASGHVPVDHLTPHGAPDHADAQLVSHDIYGVTATDSPGGVWGPAKYELFGFQQLTQLFGKNVPQVFEPDQGFLAEGVVVTEVEYALAVSPAAGPNSPKADFSADVTSGPAPLTVNFTDQSAGNITARNWDFEADSAVDSTETNPAHTYAAPGLYSVLLTVSGPDGADTEVKVEYITVTGCAATTEIDVYTNSSIETQLVTPTGAVEPLHLSGPSTVHVFFEGPTEGDASDDDGDGRDDVRTEMVQLNLTGTSSLGAVQVNLNPTLPSGGQIEENANNTPGRLDLPPFAPSGMADSFFDVFVEIQIGGQTLHTAQPLSLYGTLKHKPAAPGDFYQSSGQIPLLDAAGFPTSFLLGLTKYTPNPASFDWGDAPDSPAAPLYPTLAAHNGASHVIGGPWLGNATDVPDAEPDGQPGTPDATGDDSVGSDDEDGVAMPVLVPGQPADIAVTVSGGAGLVQAWIDFNGDGSWQHPSEQVFSGLLPIGSHTIIASVPAASKTGPTFARFRISSQGGLGPDGPAPDGEVEDYRVIVEAGQPTSGIEGVVRLQGRYIQAGASVSAGGQTVLTDMAGYFFLPLLSGTYDVTASMPGYLPGTYTGAVVTSVITLPQVNLKGGDADNDSDVDVADLVLVAAHFGQSPASVCCDFNSDDAVNVVDLTIVGMNFAHTESPWP
ncbi:MAG: GEVED domain-containing protein [Dehalococcoidia bacterium]|nr:GEVED domain-containing protein [Dehalococcoidia bacterium]